MDLPLIFVQPILDEQEKPGRNSVWITFGAFTGAENVMQVGNIVDVRDVAEGHVLGLTVEEAAGQRFLIINRDFAWQEACTSSFSSVFAALKLASQMTF